MTEDRPVILFDALCVLCSANAQFVLKHDRSRRFRLASIQSEAGMALAIRHGVDPDHPATMLVIERNRVWRDSDAALAVYAGLNGPWPAIAAVARLVPQRVRDPAYRWVARHRYRLFGRRATCWLPHPADRDRLL